jgi:hypothetical protein
LRSGGEADDDEVDEDECVDRSDELDIDLAVAVVG